MYLNRRMREGLILWRERSSDVAQSRLSINYVALLPHSGAVDQWMLLASESVIHLVSFTVYDAPGVARYLIYDCIEMVDVVTSNLYLKWYMG